MVFAYTLYISISNYYIFKIFCLICYNEYFFISIYILGIYTLVIVDRKLWLAGDSERSLFQIRTKDLCISSSNFGQFKRVIPSHNVSDSVDTNATLKLA